jgi:hypothetical protein
MNTTNMCIFNTQARRLNYIAAALGVCMSDHYNILSSLDDSNFYFHPWMKVTLIMLWIVLFPYSW